MIPGPPGHDPAFHMPGSLMPIPVFLEQQRLAAAQAAAVWESQRQWLREQLRQQGAVCEFKSLRSDGHILACTVPVCGRCATCHRAFCDSHCSWNRDSSYLARLDQCGDCQTAVISRDVEQARQAEADAMERVRQERERREQANTEHQARVAQHEQESGWEEARVRIAQLDRAISELGAARPVSPRQLGAVVVVMLCSVVFLAAIGIFGTAEGWFCTLAWLLPLFAWAGWTLSKADRERIRRQLAGERELLGWRSGCGERHCTRCYRPAMRG